MLMCFIFCGLLLNGEKWMLKVCQCLLCIIFCDKGKEEGVESCMAMGNTLSMLNAITDTVFTDQSVMKWFIPDIAFVLYGILFCHLLILRNKHPNLRLELLLLEVAGVPVSHSLVISTGTWLGSELVKSHWPWTGICSSSAEGLWVLLSLHSAAQTASKHQLHLLSSAQQTNREETPARFDICPENPSGELLKVPDLCCPALLLGRAVESIQPIQGLVHMECRSLRCGNGALSSQIELLPVLGSQWHYRALSYCLACLPCMLFPVSGQMLQMLHLGHDPAAALPRKLGRVGLYCTGSCRDTVKESALTPKNDEKEAGLLCSSSEISSPIFPSLEWSSSSLAFIFLTQM